MQTLNRDLRNLRSLIRGFPSGGAADVAEAPPDLRSGVGLRRVGRARRVLVGGPVSEGLGDAVRAGPRILGGRRPARFAGPQPVQAVPLPAGPAVLAGGQA